MQEIDGETGLWRQHCLSAYDLVQAGGAGRESSEPRLGAVVSRAGAVHELWGETGGGVVVTAMRWGRRGLGAVASGGHRCRGRGGVFGRGTTRRTPITKKRPFQQPEILPGPSHGDERSRDVNKGYNIILKNNNNNN